MGKKIMDLLGGEGEKMTIIWETRSSSDPRTLVGLFELTICHSRVIDSPRALPLELQRNKDTVRCPLHSKEVPGHCQLQLS